MKCALQIISLLAFIACSPDVNELAKTGEASFRNTLNYGRELTEHEIDSIESLLPLYRNTNHENKFYDLLVRKGIVSEERLDTSGLNFSEITWEEPSISLLGRTVELDTSGGRDWLIVKENKKVLKADLGPRLLGDRFVSISDLDSDGATDFLVMEKFYVMNGYNFELKLFSFR